MNEYLFEDRGDRSLGRVLEGAGADVLCFGHTHKPFHKIVSAEAEKQARSGYCDGAVPNDRICRIRIHADDEVMNEHLIRHLTGQKLLVLNPDFQTVHVILRP